MHNLKLLFPLVFALLAGRSAAQLRQVAIIDIPGRPGFDSMAFANKQLVIAHHGASAVDVFDPARRRLTKQIVGMADPRGIAVDNATGRVYVANAGNNTIAVISAANWQVEAPISVEHSPASLLLHDRVLYVAESNQGSIVIIDLEHNQPLATVAIGGRPEHMVADSSTGWIFITVEDQSEVVALDRANQIAKRYKLVASQPTGIALDPKSRHLFVAVRYAVVVLDADTGAEISRVPAPAGTDSLWFDPDKSMLYAAASDGSVTLISTGKRFMSEQELHTSVRGHTLAFDAARDLIYFPGGREGRSKLVILKHVERSGVSARNGGTTKVDSRPLETSATK